MSQNLQINDILNLVRETNKSLEKKIYIPSLRDEISVRPMTANHLKQVITTTLSGVFSNILFNQLVFDLLNELVVDQSVIEKLTTLDKVAILLQLRSINVRDTLEFSNLVNDETGESVEIKHSVPIQQIIEKIKKEVRDFSAVKIVSGDFELNVNIPSLSTEFLFNRHFEQTYKKMADDNSAETIKKIFGALFIYELGQYIQTIRIKDVTIDFNTLPVENRIGIINSLPGQVASALIQDIDSCYGKILKLNSSVSVEIDKKQYTGKIEIGPTLLT